ncbi:NUDIX hydrolase [Roseinatronobacter sp. NSM]|uniref:NUDIX hydrolase n=1 Tax=Roseinatronobacter sp. NSM TaxID=3457785 RepID=UPI0040354C86
MNAVAMSRTLLNLIADQVRPAFVQAAALCLRDGPTGPEVLLVRTLRLRQWVIPKGWPMKGKSLAQAAAIEAWEEAGVRGIVSDDPIGAFTYTKIKKSGLPVTCRAQVYRLDVLETADTYPEARKRHRQWFPVAQAADIVRDPEVQALLQKL